MDIPFNFAFGQINNVGHSHLVNDSGGSKIWFGVELDDIVGNSSIAGGPVSLYIPCHLTEDSVGSLPRRILLDMREFLFQGPSSSGINIFGEGGLDDGVDIRISDAASTADISMIAQDMGVFMPSSDNEAIEIIRELAYEEVQWGGSKGIDVFYRRIFENPKFYTSVVSHYIENLKNQGML